MSIINSIRSFKAKRGLHICLLVVLKKRLKEVTEVIHTHDSPQTIIDEVAQVELFFFFSLSCYKDTVFKFEKQTKKFFFIAQSICKKMIEKSKLTA